MKKIALTTVWIILFISCKQSGKEKMDPNQEMVLNEHKEFYGNWVGDFVASEHNQTADFVYSNKINIVIKAISGSKVFGQSIVAGNVRPLVGSFTIENGEFHFILREPGDAVKDGKFDFFIVNDSLKGTWFANDSTQQVTQRTFELVKQNFKYNPELMLPNERDYIDYYSAKIDTVKEFVDGEEDVYETEFYRSASDVILKLNASTTKLNEEQLKNLKKLELQIIKNTIYARHGYTFKKKNYRQFFDPVEWYVPVSDDVSPALTILEKENIKLLNRFEQYAEDNYDTFGR